MGNIKDFIQNDSTQRTITGQRFLEYDKQPWDTNDLLIRIFGLPPVNGFSPSLYDVIVANGGGGGGGTGLATIAKQDDQIGRLDTIISRVNYIEGYIGDPTVLGYTHGSIEALHNIDGWLANVSNNSDTITANVATAANQVILNSYIGNAGSVGFPNLVSLINQSNAILGTIHSDLSSTETIILSINDRIGNPVTLGYTHGSIEALHNIDGWLANVSNNSDTITANVATAVKQDAIINSLGVINYDLAAISGAIQQLVDRPMLSKLLTVKISAATLDLLVTAENSFFAGKTTLYLVSKNTFIDALQYSTILTYSNA